MQMETPDIQRGEEIRFEISLFATESDQANQGFPSVDINGTAKICNILEVSGGALSYIGFGFVNLPSGSEAALAFWLKAHQAILTRI